VITLSAKANSFIKKCLPQQQFLRLRMYYCTTLTPDGSIRAELIRRSLERFKSYMQDVPAQPLNLELSKSYLIVPVTAKVKGSLAQKGAERNSPVA
jgi:hypothetical protein